LSFVLVPMLQGGDCDSVYLVAMQNANVTSRYDLKKKSYAYFLSEQFLNDFTHSKFDVGIGYGGFKLDLGATEDQVRAWQQKIKTIKYDDIDESISLHSPDPHTATLLKFYNDCRAGIPVSVNHTFTPGDKQGSVSVKTTPLTLKTGVRSIHGSGVTVKENGPLKKNAEIDNAGITADFDVQPAAKVAWIGVQTDAGYAYDAFALVTPTPTATPANSAIRTKKVVVPAKRQSWTRSGIWLSDQEEARVTVTPTQNTWTLSKNNPPSSYQGLNSRAAQTYLVPGLQSGCLAVAYGDGSKTGFGPPGSNDVLKIASPGEIRFACNDNLARLPGIGRPNRYADNEGEIEAVIEVFPKAAQEKAP